jgi:hypothetical protein
MKAIFYSSLEQTLKKASRRFDDVYERVSISLINIAEKLV